MEENLAKVDELKVVAQELGATLPQLAIAWTAKNPNVSTVIMGATKEAQVSSTSYFHETHIVPLVPPACQAKHSAELWQCAGWFRTFPVLPGGPCEPGAMGYKAVLRNSCAQKMCIQCPRGSACIIFIGSFC